MRLIIALLLFSITASAQVTYQGGVTTTVINRGAFITDSVLGVPIRDTTTTFTGQRNRGRITVSIDSNLYYHNGKGWVKLSPTGTPIPYSDTATKVATKFRVDSLRFIDSSSYYIAPLVENANYTSITGGVTKVGATTWRSTSSTLYNVGRANRLLPSGKDGWYSMRNYADAYGGIVLDTATPTSVPRYLIGVSIYNGTLYYTLNNTATSLGSATANYYRVRRAGSVWTLESSNDEITWTNVHTYSFTYTGTVYPFNIIENAPRLGRIYEPKLYSFATTGCIIGNSTVASYLGQKRIDEFMFTSQEAATGFAATNIAVPGHTIAQQRAAWEAQSTATKKAYQWIIVEIGLNDLNPAESAATAMARYQTLIDTLYSQKSPNCKIILATMTPLKQRLIDVYGSVNGLVSWQKWKDMNNAIMTTVTKADYRFKQHTQLMGNINGNLDTAYEVYGTYDHVHQNDAGRRLQALYYRQALQELKLLPNNVPIKYNETNGEVALTSGGGTISGYIGSSNNKAFEATASTFTIPYAVATGTVTGDSLIGGTGSGGNLQLQSTSNATKGKTTFDGAGYFDGALNTLLVGGTTAPSGVTFASTQKGYFMNSGANANNTIHAAGGNAVMTFRQSNGTLASPSATTSGNVLGQITYTGWDGTTQHRNSCEFRVSASENWTSTAWGTQGFLSSAINGAASRTERFSWNGAGDMLFNQGGGNTFITNRLLVANSSYSGDNRELNVNGQAYVGDSLIVNGVLKVNTTVSAVLDFPNTSNGDESDLTITVTGAADGDVVALGTPAGSSADGSFHAYVSAANTVTVRFVNHKGTSVDPPSGTFKVIVFK